MAKNCQKIKINQTCVKDLILTLSGYYKGGIDMNLIAFCSPTHIYWSDSCLFGLGGYSNEGYASWRFEIPDDL